MTYPNTFATQVSPLALSTLDDNFNWATDIQSQAITVNAGGTADAITATYSPATTSLVNGLTLYVLASAANTTTTPTFSPNGLTAKTIVKATGALLIGDIVGSGHWLQLQYSSSLGQWVLANPKTAIGITSGTAVASTSGTSITFTGIPSSVKRITMMLSGVSTTSTNPYMIRIGSGSLSTTGYVSNAVSLVTSTVTSINPTIGFYLSGGAMSSAGFAYYGMATFTLIGSNIWVMQGSLADNAGTFRTFSGGITLAGSIDRISLTTSTGVDTFDAGTVNILYEF